MISLSESKQIIEKESILPLEESVQLELDCKYYIQTPQTKYFWYWKTAEGVYCLEEWCNFFKIPEQFVSVTPAFTKEDKEIILLKLETAKENVFIGM